MSNTLQLLFCGLALAGLALTGCGLGGAAPTPVAPAQQSPAPAASPAAGGAIAFERYEILRPSADPEQPLAHTENLRLRSQAELDAFLKAIGAEAGTRIRVDFTKQEILAFYDAGGSSGCADRTLRSLTATGGAIKPVYGSENELAPDPNRACTEIFIFPGYDLYTMARSELPVEGVKAYEAGKTAAFRTVLDGQYCGVEAFKTVTVRTQAELDALWKDLGDEPKPTIDFSKEMLVGIFLGARSSGGYEVVVKDADGLTVTYEEQQPDGPAATVMTQPFTLVALPKREGEVQFKKLSS